MLIEEYRGPLLENTHDGRVCVADANGNVTHSVGDANAMTYYRSASKPFQVLPLITRGLEEAYGFTTEELTVCAGSHAGQSCHVQALEGILAKTGLKEADLVMKPTLPAHPATRDALVCEGAPARKLYHNCSGKHLALMLLQRELGGDVQDYWRIQSPAQQAVLHTIAAVSNWPAERVLYGLDGCGVPVFAVPLWGIAAAYAKLAKPAAVQDEQLAAALAKMAAAMHAAPVMMRGEGFLCGEINTVPNLVGKGGAQGVYGMGLVDEDIGIAVKIADGTEQAWPLILAETLRQLGYKDDAAYAMFGRFASQTLVNDNGEQAGRYETVFKLRKV